MSGLVIFLVVALVIGTAYSSYRMLKRSANWKYPKVKLPPGVKPQPYSDDDD